jgi:hypothetical protein
MLTERKVDLARSNSRDRKQFPPEWQSDISRAVAPFKEFARPLMV